MGNHKMLKLKNKCNFSVEKIVYTFNNKLNSWETPRLNEDKYRIVKSNGKGFEVVGYAKSEYEAKRRLKSKCQRKK